MRKIKIACVLLFVLLVCHPCHPVRAEDHTGIVAAFVQDGIIYTYAQLPESDAPLEARASLYKDEEASETLIPYKTEKITDDMPVSYMVLLDVSGSMKAYREQITLFADCFWTDANGDLRFYLGEIGDAFTISEMFTDKNQLLEAINAALFDAPRTNLYTSVSDAVAFYDKQPRASGQFNIIVVITDGKDTSGKNADVIIEALETADPVMICTVTVNAAANDKEALATIANATYGVYGTLSDKASAERLAKEITQRVNLLTFAKFKYPSGLLGQEGYALELRYFDMGILSPSHVLRANRLTFIEDAALIAQDEAYKPESDAPPATPEQIATPSAIEQDLPESDASVSSEIGAELPTKGLFGAGSALPIVLSALALLSATLFALFIIRRFRKSGKQDGRKKLGGGGIPIAAEFAKGNILRLTLPTDGEILIGRDKYCDITLSDDSAEPKNSRLFLSDGAVFIEDLNSTNGTYVDGMRIHAPSKLRSNCEIRIGTEVFVMKF
jgi:hypothetical protein